MYSNSAGERFGCFFRIPVNRPPEKHPDETREASRDECGLPAKPQRNYGHYRRGYDRTYV